MKLIIFILCCMLKLIEGNQNYVYIKGPVNELSKCPGKYCGRMLLTNSTSWSECGACDRGLRKNDDSACELCTDDPTIYDWMYLGFMALLPLICHLFCIDKADKRLKLTKEVVILYGIAFVEIGISAILSILIFHPIGSLKLKSCRILNLSDWYPLLHNPNPNYEGTLHCTQEAVYPLYSIVLVFYTLCLLVMVVCRAWLSPKLLPGRGQLAIYSAMYFLPAFIVIHAVFGGLLYYSFPYIVICISVMSNAAYFACQLDQSIKRLLLGTITNVRSILILSGHWFLHAYGIVALTNGMIPALLVLIPLPSLFYIFTSKFSDPSLF